MSTQITRQDFEDAARYATNTITEAKKVSGKGESAVGKVTRTVIGGASALGYGYLEGWKGPIKVGFVNADLIGAGVLHAAAFAGFAGKWDECLHASADGLLFGYLGRWGVGLGTDHRKGALTQGSRVRTGGQVVTGGRVVTGKQVRGRGAQPLTLAELVGLAQKVR